MAAVTVGVEVGRKDEVHAVFVKNRHPDPAGFGKPFGPGFGTAGKTVLQWVFMHNDDFPFFSGGSHIPAEPGNLVFRKVRFPWGQFLILRVQDDKMDVSHVIGIELVPVVLRVTRGQGKEVDIRFRPADFPVQIICFVVAHDGSGRDPFCHRFCCVEPGIPLGSLLTVIDEVAHIDEEGSPGMVGIGFFRKLVPAGVVSGLAVREDKGRKGRTVRRVERIPVGPFFPIACPVFIIRSGLQLCQMGFMQIAGDFVIRKDCRFGRNGRGPVFAFETEFDDRIFFFIIRLPHDGTGGGRVLCHDLTDI